MLGDNNMVGPAGFEPSTPRLGIWCSIQLSYGPTRESSCQQIHPLSRLISKSLPVSVLAAFREYLRLFT